MEIVKATVKPYEESIFPSLNFELEIKHKKNQEAIIDLNGWLKTTDDGKIIAEINEIMQTGSRSDELAATGSRHDSGFRDDLYKMGVITFLDRRALNHIEKQRMKDRKGDVKLTLFLQVKSIVNKALLLHLYGVNPDQFGLNPIPIRGDVNGEIIVTAYDAKFDTSYSNRWVLSGNQGPSYLLLQKQDLRIDSTISSSDWIHDYAPKLELGEYFIVEIPKGAETISGAWDYIEKAEECFRLWDTKGAYANCREAGNLLNGILGDKFRNNPIIKKWNKAMARFESLTSLALHTEEIKVEKPEGEIKVGKSDTEHILIVTKALIKYAEELLQEGE